MKKFLKLILVGGVLAMALTGRTFAATNSSILTITPFLKEIKFSADEGTKDFEVEIGNDSDKQQSVRLSVLDFGSLNETGGLVFAGSNANDLVKKYGLANWVQLSSSSLTIDAHKSAKIQATIIDDTTLSPGGHYAAIVASLDSGASGVSNQISVNQKLSSLIFATKTGGEKYDLRLDGIDAGNSRFNLPGFVTLHFFNPGNVHVVPRGTVKIFSPNGETVSQGVINEESGYILPETSKQILVRLNQLGHKDLRTSTYKLRVDYRYDGIDTFARRDLPVYITSPLGLVILALLFAALVWAGLKLQIGKLIISFTRKYIVLKK